MARSWEPVRIVMAIAIVSAVAHPTVANDSFFEARIRPLLVKRCYECHGPDEAAGRLRLDSRDGWQRGGESGPVIVPGDPSASLLIQAVSYQEADLRMPPEDSGGKLTAGEIRDLVEWIRRGASDPRTGLVVRSDIDARAASHWAFQPVEPPEVVEGIHPIDFLVNERLREQGLVATKRAEPKTLLRRASLNLLGLPPTAQQLSESHDSFDAFVEQLLNSPHYGERWGRHWLDVARYSDAKDGVLMYGDARIRPFAYTYRDYVIRAFNDDKPFDQFVREQLAADQLGLPKDSPNLAAMGFLTLGRMFDNNRHDVIDDQIDVVTRGFLGLTVSCARCHDHKFDPIPTADYYSLYGVFASSIEPYDRPRISPVSEAGREFEQEFSAKLEEVAQKEKAHYEETLRTARERTPDYLVQVATTDPDVSETAIFFLSLIPDQLRPQITWRWRKLIARRAFPDDPVFGPWFDLMRSPQLQAEQWAERGVDPRIIGGLERAKPQTPAEVARTYGRILRQAWKNEEPPNEDDPLVNLLVSRQSPVWFPQQDIYYYLSRSQKDAYRGLLNQLDAIAVKQKAAASRAMVLVDAAVAVDPVIFQRGDPNQRGNPVPRRFLKLLAPEGTPFPDGSGRSNLADAIVSPSNPLTARVWVNRIWMHHFGEPLVDDAGDFGIQSRRPLQQELLDFLADFLVRNGWRTKPLHRLIMSSQTYQRSSRIPATPKMRAQLDVDPNNKFLWHFNRRRLDFEQMRDSVLAVSGQLDEAMYGRPPAITDETNHRRTVYAFVERQNIPAIVQTFDFANADTSTSRRVTTTVPQQALFAMNSKFMLSAARRLAERNAATGPGEQVRGLYQTVLGRAPSAEELRAGIEFTESQSGHSLAHVLLMSNEFMFVD